jgi:hypothetical protein
MKFFVALAAALVLAQGAEAAQTKKTAASARRTKPVAAKSLKKQKIAKASSSSATQAASQGDLEANSSSSIATPTASQLSSAGTSTAKASTTVKSLKSRIGLDSYNLIETGMRATNTGGDALKATDNNVGISYKLTDSSKVYLRQQYTFDLPNTGRSAGMNDEVKAKAGDMYVRYQNSKFMPILNDGALGGRVTLSLPTGEASRTDLAKMHNGKISARATVAKPVSKLFNWDYLIQVGYNNMANKGVLLNEADKSGHAAGTFAPTTQFSYAQNLGLNFEVGSGITITQSIGSTGGWTNATQDYGVEQSNKIALGTAVQRSFGPVTVAVGVSQEGNIMPDAPKEERWSPDKFMDDESSSYYLELSTSI